MNAQVLPQQSVVNPAQETDFRPLARALGMGIDFAPRHRTKRRRRRQLSGPTLLQVSKRRLATELPEPLIYKAIVDQIGRFGRDAAAVTLDRIKVSVPYRLSEVCSSQLTIRPLHRFSRDA